MLVVVVVVAAAAAAVVVVAAFEHDAEKEIDWPETELVAAGIDFVAEIVVESVGGHGPVKQSAQHEQHGQQDRRACCGRPEPPLAGSQRTVLDGWYWVTLGRRH